jgi:uncharacterized membrane protein
MNFRDVNKRLAQAMENDDDAKAMVGVIVGLSCLIVSLALSISIGILTHFVIGILLFGVCVVTSMYGMFTMFIYLENLAKETTDHERG